MKNPTVSLAVDEAEQTTKVSPITDPARVSDVVDRFRAKYGSADVTAYYTNPKCCRRGAAGLSEAPLARSRVRGLQACRRATPYAAALLWKRGAMRDRQRIGA